MIVKRANKASRVFGEFDIGNVGIADGELEDSRGFKLEQLKMQGTAGDEDSKSFHWYSEY